MSVTRNSNWQAHLPAAVDPARLDLLAAGSLPAAWGNPAATAEAFDPDGWFRTGDLGSFDERGYLRIEGRGKELIITGGYNVHPREVEELLLEHPGVAEVAVVGAPSEQWGEQVAAFKRPRVLHYVEALPRNALGKMLKHELRP